MPKSLPFRKLAQLCGMISLFTLTSCAIPIQTAGIKDSPADPKLFCSQFGPVKFSRLNDTKETIENVKEYNRKIRTLCGLPVPPIE